jgi:hypothetical protein
MVKERRRERSEGKLVARCGSMVKVMMDLVILEEDGVGTGRKGIKDRG